MYSLLKSHVIAQMCVWGIYARMFRNIHMCVHVEARGGYWVACYIPHCLTSKMGSLTESGARLAASKPQSSSCLCLPKHQGYKHTWPHLKAYIGAWNLNSGPHGSAALLPTEPFLQPCKMHVVVSYPYTFAYWWKQMPSLLWVVFRESLGDQLNKSQEDKHSIHYRIWGCWNTMCVCNPISPKLSTPQETASEEGFPELCVPMLALQSESGHLREDTILGIVLVSST